ncbi:hypothetical protein HOC35_01790 [Candidatus Woesearchaeota archaeon]|jgi:hypothetical protein|nr:hypothetical protein [Candidatus Woesearchaeota archaeon]
MAQARNRTAKKEGGSLSTWVQNKQPLEELMQNRGELTKNTGKLATQNKLFTGKDLLVECQQELIPYIELYEQLKVYEDTPIGTIKKKIAPLKAFIDSTVDLIGQHVRIQFGDANTKMQSSIESFIEAEQSEKEKKVTPINNLAKNYFLFDNAINLGKLDLVLSESAETHKANEFIVAYGRAVHEVETFSLPSLERAYARATTPIEIMDLAESLELKLRSVVSEQRKSLDNYSDAFPSHASKRDVNEIINSGIKLTRNSLYREIRTVMKDSEKYFKFKSKLESEIGKLRKAIEYVDNLSQDLSQTESYEETLESHKERLGKLKQQPNYLEKNKRLGNMRLVQIEAGTYSKLYSQLIDSVDGVLNYSDNTNQTKEAQLKNLVSQEEKVETEEKGQHPSNIDNTILETDLPYNPNTRLQDLTMPENGSLKELYLTLHRISERGLQIITSPTTLAKKIDEFEIPVQDATQEEKDFLTGVVGYLNNPNVKHYGHFTQVNPIKNHVQCFLKKYAGV